jgi:hypothetical protein
VAEAHDPASVPDDVTGLPDTLNSAGSDRLTDVTPIDVARSVQPVDVYHSKALLELFARSIPKEPPAGRSAVVPVGKPMYCTPLSCGLGCNATVSVEPAPPSAILIPLPAVMARDCGKLGVAWAVIKP